VTLVYPSSTSGGVWCGVDSDTLTWASSQSNNIPKAQIQQQTIPPQPSSRFVRTLRVSQIWSILAGNMLNALSAKRNYAKGTDWKLTINNITQYRWMKGYYLTEFFHLPAGITLSHHGLTTVGAPECHRQAVNLWSTLRQRPRCTTTGRYSQRRTYQPSAAWSYLYPWYNQDKGS
jgi:hypothetical protein